MMPVKVKSVRKPLHQDLAPQGCNAKSRLNREDRDDDHEQKENFVQELEDRVEADLEVENIFLNLSQEEVSQISMSLPERPTNPIVNDQVFLQGNEDRIDQKSKLCCLSLEKLTSLSQRECSIERQKRIFQEDLEAQNEIKELFLSPSTKIDSRASTFYSLSCSSEISSFEVEVSKPLLKEIYMEN